MNRRPGHWPRSDRALARRILGYAPWPQVALATVLSMLAAATAQTLPLLQRRAIDDVLVPALASAQARVGAAERVLEVMAAYLGVAAAAFAADYSFNYLVQRLGQRVLGHLRTDLFKKLMRLPVAYFDRNAAGQVVNRVMGDVEAIGRFISAGLVVVAQSAIGLATVLCFMFALEWRLALVACAVLPVMALSVNALQIRQRQAHRATQQAQGAMAGVFAENVAGMSTVQIFNREARNRLHFDRANRALLAGSLAAQRWFTLTLPAIALINASAIAALLLVGGSRVLAGAATVGTLFAFLQYMRTFFQPVQELSVVSEVLQSAMASAERVFAVLDEEESVGDPADAVTAERFRGEVQFDGVWFGYGAVAEGVAAADGWVLRGLDLHVRSGESVALVGATGAGKTTIISLLARLYDVQKGHVRVDGVDVQRYAQRDLRRHIGVVLQDPHLFAGTIESNLRLRGETTLERAVEACRVVGMHDYILSLPEGYRTELGERGATLSTGQKQLLSFARALALDPDILVVLDEATASVDSESEAIVQEALRRMRRGRTCLVIAHRLSTVRDCDRIVVLRHGRLIEDGSHGELMAKGGHYAALAELQFGAAAASIS